jgi:hypothetical protein
MKFLVIYKTPITAQDQIAKASPAEAKAGMDAWMSWMQKAGKQIVDGGAPVGKSAQVGGGKSTDVKSDIGGYSILQADSRAAVVELTREHPHLRMPGATIEVHEFLQIPGM